jgi:hypothetical protein
VRGDGTQVHELLANFQGCFVESPRCVDGMGKPTMGGWGYLRIMRFDPANHRVSVKTYSPVIDMMPKDPGRPPAHLTDPANEFQLDLDQ